ncbi:DnaD domain-containing protein [Paenibacillus sinopodophylli]|uniref:DnaD domain-containing protein n=1 Tax=Paenibacillus sinopodophylli TaxID=1837342 RepID=UPI001FE3CBF1|nr:DnaD domain protein [Paenibacillus sinopodophylli]
MAWIESHQELARHPKTKRLSRKLGVTVPTVVGHLHMLWWWAVDYAQDGNISDYDPEDIAEAIDWPTDKADNLLQALVDAGFVDKVERCVTIHDWFDYAGRLVDNREKNKERKRKSRENIKKGKESHANVTSDTSVTLGDGSNGHGATVPNQTLPYLTRPNPTQQDQTNTIQEQSGKPPAGGIDPNYNPFRLFEAEGFGTISSVTADKINCYIDDFGERWVCEAMKIAVVAGKRNLTYVNGILKKFKSEGVDDPWNAERKPGASQSSSRSGKPRIDIVPEEQAKTEMSEVELREIHNLARKMENKPPLTDAEFQEILRESGKE